MKSTGCEEFTKDTESSFFVLVAESNVVYGNVLHVLSVHGNRIRAALRSLQDIFADENELYES